MRVARYVLTVLFSVVVISIYWSYHVAATAYKAKQFEPRPAGVRSVPAGTSIPAEIRHSISKESSSSQTVIAFVSRHVQVDGTTVIGRGALLQGRAQEISAHDHRAIVRVHFTTLHTAGRTVTIRSQPVVVELQSATDAEIFRNAMSVLFGGVFGAGLASGSKDEEVINAGLVEGIIAGMPAAAPSPLTVTLEEEVTVTVVRDVGAVYDRPL